MLDALSPFEKAYISRSQSRLLDSVSQLFGPSSRGLPREDEIMGISKTFNRSTFISVFDHAKISLINMCVSSQVRELNMTIGEGEGVIVFHLKCMHTYKLALIDIDRLNFYQGLECAMCLLIQIPTLPSLVDDLYDVIVPYGGKFPRGLIFAVFAVQLQSANI